MINWISANERIPEEFEPVLVYMPEEAPFPTVREGYFSPCGFMVPAIMQHNPDVTHWAEMPGGDIRRIPIKSWSDYEDGDQIQITDTDGTVYLFHSSKDGNPNG